MAPISQCLHEFQDCWSGGCSTVMDATLDPVLVNTNQSSFVGLEALFSQQCVCESRQFSHEAPTCGAYSCLNGGTCQENWNGYK